MKKLALGLCVLAGLLASAGCSDRNVRNEMAADDLGSSPHHMTGDDTYFDGNELEEEPRGQIHVDFGRK